MNLPGMRVVLPIGGTPDVVHLEENKGRGELYQRMSEKVATLTAAG